MPKFFLIPHSAPEEEVLAEPTTNSHHQQSKALNNLILDRRNILRILRTSSSSVTQMDGAMDEQ